MRITDLKVDGFGVWSGLNVEEVGPGMTVFYGPNEAGKTTLLQFVRAILYGFAEERREKYLPPVHGGQPGGSICFKASNGEYQVQRLEFPNDMSRLSGELMVTASDGTTSGDEGLQRLLGDIDESVFSNVFAIGLREIQELATLNDTEAAHELYKLASGLDRVSLIDVMRSLRSDREFIAGSASKAGRLQELTSELKDVERQIEQVRGASRRWARLGVELAEIDGEVEQIKQTIDEQEKQARRVEMAIQIAPRWRERDAVESRIEALGELPDPDKISPEKLDRVNQKIGQLEARGEEASSRVHAIKQEAQALPINPVLLSHSCRIEAITEHQPWMESLERQIERLRDEVEHLHAEMGIKNSRDDAAFLSADAADLEVSPRSMSILKTPVKAIKKAKQRLEIAERERSEADLHMASTREELDGQLQDRDCEDLDEAIEEAGLRVNQIKRRKQVDDRLRRLDQQRRQMDDEIELANEAQVMPIGRTMLVGAFVIMGLGLALFGFAGRFLESVPVNPMMGMFGIALALGGWIVKLVGDSRARNHMERTQRQQELLNGQIQRAKRERDELPYDDAGDTRPVAEVLAEAEHELAAMENLIPFRNELAACQELCDEAQLNFENAEQGVANAQKRWESSLRSVNLPPSLTPARVKALYEQSARIGDSRTRLGECRQELQEREIELEHLTERVTRIATEAGLYRSDIGSQDLIDLMIESLGEQRRLKEQRSELRKQFKAFSRQMKSLKRQRRRYENFKSRMLESVGARDDKAYRDIAFRITQRIELSEQLVAIDQQIDAALGKQFDRDLILEIVQEWGDRGLDAHWERLLAEVEKHEKSLADLNVLRGERQHEMKTLGEDRESDRLEWHAETLRAELRKHANRWRALATANSLLDSVRRRYEEERQPETLNEASRYLADITERKYVRIWTRLEGDSLFVDQEDGKTLRVDVLSQGTREAIFLALRLALASAYARRGIVFPLVLDDLLVNYDANRTRAAARVLLKYATRHKQLVFFTCHDHIRDLFHELEADVRVLPTQHDVLDHDATAERYVVEEPYDEEEEEPVEEELVEEELEDVSAELEEPEEELEDEEEVEAVEEDEYEEEFELVDMAEDEEPIEDEPEEDEFEEEYDEEYEDDFAEEEEVVDEAAEEVEAAVEELLETVRTPAPPEPEPASSKRERLTWNTNDMWWD